MNFAGLIFRISLVMAFMTWFQAEEAKAEVLSGRLAVETTPVANATVSLFRINESKSDYVNTIVIRTDPRGQYKFMSLPVGQYVMLASLGDARLYEGKVSVRPNVANVKDIILEDPFVGTWKLNLLQSKLKGDEQLKSDVRSYKRRGDVVEISWKQIRTGGNVRSTKYQVKCDEELREAKSPILHTSVSCHYIAINVVEGMQEPPRVYYRRVVSGEGRIMTISIFSDSARNSLVRTYVFNRVK
jgi:hypothetical protein